MLYDMISNFHSVWQQTPSLNVVYDAVQGRFHLICILHLFLLCLWIHLNVYSPAFNTQTLDSLEFRYIYLNCPRNSSSEFLIEIALNISLSSEINLSKQDHDAKMWILELLLKGEKCSLKVFCTLGKVNMPAYSRRTEGVVYSLRPVSVLVH